MNETTNSKSINLIVVEHINYFKSINLIVIEHINYFKSINLIVFEYINYFFTAWVLQFLVHFTFENRAYWTNKGT